MPCGQKIGCTRQGKLTLPGVFDAALMWNQSIMCYGPVMLIAWYWIACAELGLLWNHPTRRFHSAGWFPILHHCLWFDSFSTSYRYNYNCFSALCLGARKERMMSVLGNVMKNRASYTLEIVKIFFSFFYRFGYHFIYHFFSFMFSFIFFNHFIFHFFNQCFYHFIFHFFYHFFYHFLSFFLPVVQKKTKNGKLQFSSSFFFIFYHFFNHFFFLFIFASSGGIDEKWWKMIKKMKKKWKNNSRKIAIFQKMKNCNFPWVFFIFFSFFHFFSFFIIFASLVQTFSEK